MVGGMGLDRSESGHGEQAGAGRLQQGAAADGTGPNRTGQGH